MEMMRNMMAAKNFPNEYWDEAVATVVYIMNRCPTKSVKKKFPQEEWTGMNHIVSRLNIFRCVPYSHVRNEVRKKLDKKGHNCIFVGYYEGTKAYKLYDPATRKVIIICNVQFVENEWCDGVVNINVNIVSNVDNDDMV